MNEFLLNHQQVRAAKEYLLANGWDPHICEIKNWDLAHVLPALRDGVILDMGCHGSSVLSNAIKRIRGAKFGIDLKPCHQQPGEVILQGDLTKTGLTSEHFDTITCLSVVEHMVSFSRLVAECKRLLKVGGNVIITFDYCAQGIQSSNPEWQPLSQQSLQALIEMFECAGFRQSTEMNWQTGEVMLHSSWFFPNYPDVPYTFGIVEFLKLQYYV